MKVRCLTNELVDAVTMAGHAVSGRSALPALDGLLLRARDNTVSLAGYDLELGITVQIEATVESPGEVVLPAGIFTSIVRGMTGKSTLIECDERQNIKIQCESAQFEIAGMPASEYPELPKVDEGEKMSIGQGVLRSMIRQTLFAVAQGESSRPVHKGSLFEWRDHHLTVVSLDGARMAIRREPVKEDCQAEFVLPRKTLAEMLKVLSDNADQQALFTVGARHALIEIGQSVFISRLVDGEFLPYRKAIPTQCSLVAMVNTEEMLRSVSRAAVVINDRVRSPLLCHFEKGRISVSCSTPQGRANDSIEAQTDGQAMEIGFNHQFLQDALRNTETDRVKMELSTPLSPMTIKPLKGDQFLFVVLPVRLNGAK